MSPVPYLCFSGHPESTGRGEGLQAQRVLISRLEAGVCGESLVGLGAVVGPLPSCRTYFLSRVLPLNRKGGVGLGLLKREWDRVQPITQVHQRTRESLSLTQDFSNPPHQPPPSSRWC